MTDHLLPCPWCGTPASEDPDQETGMLIFCGNKQCFMAPELFLDWDGETDIATAAYAIWNTRIGKYCQPAHTPRRKRKVKP